jgi:WD40 repeat protein
VLTGFSTQFDRGSGRGKIQVTPDGTQALCACADGILRVWDLHKNLERTHWRQVNAIAVARDGKRAVSVSDDHMLKVWDLARGREIGSVVAHTGAVNTIALAEDGKRAVSGSDDRMVKVWDVDSCQEIASFVGDAPSKIVHSRKILESSSRVTIWVGHIYRSSFRTRFVFRV